MGDWSEAMGDKYSEQLVMNAAEKLRNEFSPALEKVGNHIAYGIGKDPETKRDTIELRLTNDKLMNVLPKEYNGYKVNTIVVGEIIAY